MTAAEAVDFVRSRVQLKNAPFRDMKLGIEVCDPYGIRLTIRYVVPETDTGELGPIFQMEYIQDFERMPLDYFQHHVADFVRRAFLHEFGECFHVDGKRPFDPHAGEDGRPAA